MYNVLRISHLASRVNPDVIHPVRLGLACARDPAWKLLQRVTRFVVAGNFAITQPPLANAAVAMARPTRLRHVPPPLSRSY